MGIDIVFGNNDTEFYMVRRSRTKRYTADGFNHRGFRHNSFNMSSTYGRRAVFGDKPRTRKISFYAAYYRRVRVRCTILYKLGILL